MRKIIFSVVLFLFSASLFSQQTNPGPALNGQDYLQKSKKQKKTALIFLAGGAGLMATSFIIPRGELVHDGICIGPYCSDEYKNDGIKATLFIAGGVAALGSIPFFLTSAF